MTVNKGDSQMNKGRILLKLILDEINLGKLELDTFPKRLNLQKRIYLLQLTGIDLGYRYNWYLRGPYCPSLTQDTFLLKEEIGANEKDHEEYKLNSMTNKKIGKAKEIWEAPNAPSIKAGSWVELLASLHYLKHIAWPRSVSKEDIFKKLIKAKPRFASKHQLIEKAWNRLDRFGLIQNKLCSE